MVVIANVMPRTREGGILHAGATQPNAFTLIEMLITMALILIMFVMLYGKSSRRFQHEQKQACQQNLQNIYVALQLYANDTDGLFPIRKEAKTSEQALSLLLPKYTTVTAPFICPGTKESPLPEGESFEKRRISYSYYMGRRASDSTEPLMSDAQINDEPKIRAKQVFSSDGKKPGNNHHKYGGNIMNCDGNVEMIGTKAPSSLTLTQGVVLLNPKS
jgi:prepilin-type N-terminal cleavage/methylation domain-containing protein